MSDVERFHNVATADLLAMEMQDRGHLVALQSAIRERMIAESGIVIGEVYIVAADGRPFSGRRLWVEGVNAALQSFIRPRFVCFAWGRLNGRSAAGDGWTIKRQNVDVARLTIEDAKA